MNVSTLKCQCHQKSREKSQIKEKSMVKKGAETQEVEGAGCDSSVVKVPTMQA